MRDYYSIGPTPNAEDCAQVGSQNYREQAIKEMRAYINQLRRVFGEEPGSARLKMKWFPHDFGTYGEVVCEFNDSDEEGGDYAANIENGCDEWDEEAKKELGLIT